MMALLLPSRRQHTFLFLGIALLTALIVAEAQGADPAPKPEPPPLPDCWTFVPRKLADEVIVVYRQHGLPLPPSIGAGGDAVFVARPNDHRILCLDAESGKLRWEFTPGGLVREAPTFWDGKVYFGSDDGCVYCLDAASGKVVWKVPPPGSRRQIAYGKAVSAFPVRTNVLVHKGVAYFGSGIFPHDGSFVTAVDAKTGKLVWQNAASGEYPHDWGALSPIGLLQVSAEGDRLLVANEYMEGKPFRLSDGFEFHRAAKGFRQQFHVVGSALGDRKFGLGKDGAIVCQAPPGAKQHGTTAESDDKNAMSDPKAAKAADAILKHAPIKDGYALVLDCKTGSLALELARRTNLIVCAIFGDEAACETARRVMQPSGLYGVRIIAYHQPADQKLVFPPYFADLIVSESACLDGSVGAGLAADVAAHLKPIRGAALIGSAESKVTREALQQFGEATGLEGWGILDAGGRWAKCLRKPLKGAGAWTHQNADPGNTMCADDDVLRPPLGVVWYGGPIAAEMVNRSGIAPLIFNGVFVSPGANILEGYDQYTGRRLWRREMARVSRTNPYGESGNLASNGKDLFVSYIHQVHRIDPWTGETIKTYGDGAWGFIAVDDKRLYGSSGGPAVGKGVYAVDIETGKKLWDVNTGALQFQNNTIAIGGGSLYFIEDGYNDEARKQGCDETLAYAKKALPEADWKKIEATQKVRDIRILVAVDVETGKIRYERGIDVSDCGGATDDFEGLQRRKYPPALIYKDGLLAHYNASAGGKLWGNWANNNWAWRGIAVRKAADGGLVWFKPVNFRGRVLCVNDTLHADPYALDLKTGAFKTRIHPISGQEEKWTWCRWNKHCGIYVSSGHFLFGRSGGIGYQDLLRDRGLYTFLHSRPSCWFDTVSGGGLMVKPPHSNGCTCQVTGPFTIAMGTVDREPAAPQIYSTSGPSTPVKHLYLNVGGMGDYSDAKGNLWVAADTFRSNAMIPMMQFKAALTYYDGGQSVVRSAAFTPIANTDMPSVFATMALGLKSITIPLDKEEPGKPAAPAKYRVSLGFAAPPGDTPGKRIFDVKLQGKAVLKGLDVVMEAGGPDRAVWKDFDDVEASAALTVELAAPGDKPAPDQMPILNAMKIIPQ